MNKKRIAGLLALTAALTLCMPVTAFAHHGRGHHGCGYRAGVSSTSTAAVATSYCPLEDCSLGYTHEHNGVTYYAHCANDGHDYHAFCSVEGCTLTGIHEHNGSCYVGCLNADGTCMAGHAYHHGY